MLTLGNPAGLWALLGIPAVLVIHLLQRKTQRIRISTLFLLGQLQQEQLSGSRIEKLRSSVPLWLQLLMVLVLSWLITRPTWLEQAPVQRVVVVMDGSASMTATKPKILAELPKALKELQRLANTTEYILLDSRLREESIYRGTQVEDVQKALENWQPSSGAHDSQPSLRLGRSLAGHGGLLVFVTDQAGGPLPLEARRLAFGESTTNIGLTTLTTVEKDGQMLWKAVLKNNGSEPGTREWWTVVGGQKSAPQQIRLEPGQAKPLQGLFPADKPSIQVACTPDAFTLDDSVTVFLPKPKEIVVKPPNLADANEAAFYKKLFSSLPGVTVGAGKDPGSPVLPIYQHEQNTTLPPPEGAALLLVRETQFKPSMLTAEILKEKHTLTEGLDFQGLLATDSVVMPTVPSQTGLVWQGERPLIFLRGAGSRQQLGFNFDPYKSNARKLPAVLVLIHRYIDSIRDATPQREVANVDCGQPLKLRARTGDPGKIRLVAHPDDKSPAFPIVEQELKPEQLSTLRAPDLPGNFRILQGEAELLVAAARFTDLREADLSLNASVNELSSSLATTVNQLQREDHYWRHWLVGLLGVALGSWAYMAKRDR